MQQIRCSSDVRGESHINATPTERLQQYDCQNLKPVIAVTRTNRSFCIISSSALGMSAAQMTPGPSQPSNRS